MYYWMCVCGLLCGGVGVVRVEEVFVVGRARGVSRR